MHNLWSEPPLIRALGKITDMVVDEVHGAVVGMSIISPAGKACHLPGGRGTGKNSGMKRLAERLEGVAPVDTVEQLTADTNKGKGLWLLSGVTLATFSCRKRFVII